MSDEEIMGFGSQDECVFPSLSFAQIGNRYRRSILSPLSSLLTQPRLRKCYPLLLLHECFRGLIREVAWRAFCRFWLT
jgi:hypothetical protein